MQEGLTIIIPVRNRANLIVRTLDSIAAGAQLPRALFIVDNGSTDDTKEVCLHWIDTHRSLGMDTCFLEESRPGANIARNTGLSAVTTEWVYFFDSDDEFDVSFVADVTAAIRDSQTAQHDITLFFTPSRQEVQGRIQTRAYMSRICAATQILSAMLSTTTMVFKTSWLRTLGGWDEHLSIWQDWELGVRVAMAAPQVGWLTRRSYHLIHIHPDSITGAGYSQRCEAIRGTLRRVATEVEHDRRACRSLYLRSQIIAGKLMWEGSGDTSIRAFARERSATVGTVVRFWGTLLRRYVALGGRGAWRIALWAVCNNGNVTEK